MCIPASEAIAIAVSAIVIGVTSLAGAATSCLAKITPEQI